MGFFPVILRICFLLFLVGFVHGLGANWGTQSTHPLKPSIVVNLLRDNGFQKVKLFDADAGTMKALGKSGLQVMVGIPNDMLAKLATSVKAAEDWVSKNVSSYMSKDGVDIRYVAVGNEPFLTTYNGSFLQLTLPALQNIQSALIKAGLSTRVKPTVPLNADVYQSPNNLPSSGDFRSDIHDLMVALTKYLSDNGAPFTVNIYPFISLYNDPSFPVDFAFFDGDATPLNDGGTLYTNVFDANYDTLVWALRKNGFGSLQIIVGEVGWPTDGNEHATIQFAQKFNQGFLTRIASGKGTPMQLSAIDAYLFSLIDEDAKSIDPGNFERHWGVFNYDGSIKYQLGVGNSQLIGAKGVKYLPKKWCVLTPQANLDDPKIGESVNYACSLADCTALGYGSSCNSLDVRGNISYAFNSYFQRNNQLQVACKFPNVSSAYLSMTTGSDPTTPSCRFEIMIAPDSTASSASLLSSTSSFFRIKIQVLTGLSAILFYVSTFM
ncbi:glucan endo-1,3-beta-glucosidase 5 [Amborella trichopoda]|uniref:glucan endo-1,3-beta-D-glucosidase n=1 Tax=Amborella trichopoda TaxID=13333 RepID=W1PWP3_AMBTC|nr:glucan endo-1,3-beta-glucosidase 5 [Amborella trichopoda]ERN12593.1 hypothetical protein AMTR_s00025p00220320 [Amborella trichopoda]|eukprot:XP_006851012.1 glucan endo-1,3-beta-glucosidase 5 [Amborella trichopoda]